MPRTLLVLLLVAFALAACKETADFGGTEEEDSRRAYQNRAYQGRVASE